MQPIGGRDQRGQRERQLLNSIAEFHGTKVLNVGTGDNVSFVTGQFDYTLKEWGKLNYTRV